MLVKGIGVFDFVLGKIIYLFVIGCSLFSNRSQPMEIDAMANKVQTADQEMVKKR